MKVDVIISSYNKSRYIFDLIDELLPDPHINKIIVVDDCSTDGSWEKLCTYDNQKLIVHQHAINEGPADTKLDGVKLATTEYVCIIDADDKLSKGFFKVMTEELEKNPCDILLSICQHDRNEIRLARIPTTGHSMLEAGDVPEMAGIILRRSLFEDINSTDVRLAENMLIMAQIFAKNPSVRLCRDAKYIYTIDPESLWHSQSPDTKNWAIKNATEYIRDICDSIDIVSGY